LGTLLSREETFVLAELFKAFELTHQQTYMGAKYQAEILAFDLSGFIMT
jgi:hypothetical protein